VTTTLNKPAICITASDAQRLYPLVESRKSARDDLRALLVELKLARVVPSREVPPDVITMNSKARLRDLGTGEELVYTLAFPQNAAVEHGRISVLAPLGTAMLGRRAGEEFEWEVPDGPVRLRIEEVLYQPESAGALHR
jgi:regulator of nucleoside diphosphate kinase